MAQDFFIERWLHEEGYLYYKSAIITSPKRVIKNLINWISRYSVHFRWLKDRVKSNRVISEWGKQLRGKINDLRTTRDDIDWKNTKAYFAGASSEAIRINLRGREKQGVVHEGDEYHNLIMELKSRLQKVKDSISRSPVIKEVYHRDEIFYGPKAKEAPDLVIISEKGYALQEGFSEYVLKPSVQSVQFGMEISGVHRRDGIFIACGADIRVRAASLEAQIIDIMPTILYLNGLAIPDYVDGEVLTDIIREDYVQQHPVERTNQFPAVHVGTGEMTPEERELLKEHLRALGYF